MLGGDVCHDPAALVNVKLNHDIYLVAGKNLTPFTNGEEEVAQVTNSPNKKY